MSALHRPPLTTIAVVAVTAAAAFVLAFVLVVVPLARTVNDTPAGLVHAYQGYWDGVGQQFQQWQQQHPGGRP